MPELTIDEQADVVASFLRGLADQFGAEGTTVIERVDDDTVEIRLEGDDQLGAAADTYDLVGSLVPHERERWTLAAVTARLRDARPLADKLVNAQRAWIAYRDAECNFSSANAEGGSVYPMVVSTCLDDLTKARTDTLKGYLSCEEGDLACPVPAK